jgi:DNA-binding beta-propeller fold protein YncE
MRLMTGWLLVFTYAFAQAPPPAATEEQASELRALIKRSPKLALELAPLAIRPPRPDWKAGYVSSVATDGEGHIYALHRELTADPLIVLDRDGRILRSWGRGLYKIPHSVRIDPEGNIWTVDAGSSVVLKFTREGKKLLQIDVGGLPERRSEFRGTTDIAFAPGGRIFISDGYGNARILEYNSKGERIREWGTHGTAPGQFHVPHGIAVDRDGILYIADRENGRIQRFDMDGRYLGEWPHLGKTFSVTVSKEGDLWIGTQPRNVANGGGGWLVRVDRKTGKVLGYIDAPGYHSIHISSTGEAFTGARSLPDAIVRFRPAAAR